MRKFMMILLACLLPLTMIACEKKSTSEEVKEAANAIKNDIQNAFTDTKNKMSKQFDSLKAKVNSSY